MNKLKELAKEFIRCEINKRTRLSFFILFLIGLIKRDWRNYKIVNVTWMDCEKKSKYKGLLRTKRKAISIGPKYTELNINSISEIELKEVFFHIFTDSQISATSSSVYANENILIERLGRKEEIKFNYSSGQIKIHGESHALVDVKNPSNIEYGIFLGGNGACNYYHWLIEIVPKFEYLNELPQSYNTFPLLIPDCVQSIPSFAEILKLVSNGRQVIYLDPMDIYRVHTLVYIDTPNNLPFNLVGINRFKTSDFLFRKESLEFVRRVFLEEVNNQTGNNNTYFNKIFLARDSENGKRKYNQNEVQAKLEQLGFESIFMDKLDFKDQVRIVNNADWIVGPTGAAWANIVFAKKGAKCLCWMAEQYGEFSAFSNIAANIGVDLEYLTVNTPVHNTRHLYKKNYSIDTVAIERALLSMEINSKNKKAH